MLYLQQARLQKPLSPLSSLSALRCSRRRCECAESTTLTIFRNASNTINHACMTSYFMKWLSPHRLTFSHQRCFQSHSSERRQVANVAHLSNFEKCRENIFVSVDAKETLISVDQKKWATGRCERIIAVWLISPSCFSHTTILKKNFLVPWKLFCCAVTKNNRLRRC